MSMGKRAYNILRGYVSTEWDRIKDLERDLATRELHTDPLPPSSPNEAPLPPALSGPPLPVPGKFSSHIRVRSQSPCPKTLGGDRGLLLRRSPQGVHQAQQAKRSG